MKSLLAFAGRHGPALLFAGVLLGLAWPGLAAAVKPAMGAAVFVFTLGAFLKVDPAALHASLRRPGRNAITLLWIVVGVPLTGVALTSLLPLPEGIRLGVLLSLLAPPVGSAAAIAAMLGLDAALALTMTVVASVLSPLYLPLLIGGLGGQTTAAIDTAGMLIRVALVVGGAACAASALRLVARDAVKRNPMVMVGLSVVGLIVVGIGAMDGVQPVLRAHAGDVFGWIALAFALNGGLQIAGTLLFARTGARHALSVGLISGNRNVTLIWVAVAPWLQASPQAEVFLAASVFPIFMLPLLTRPLIAWCCRPAALAQPALAQPALAQPALAQPALARHAAAAPRSRSAR